MNMNRLFHLMAEKKASDIFLSVGSPVQIKINGTTIPVNERPLEQATIELLLSEVLTESQKKQLDETYELNIGYPVSGIGSFRLSAFRQRGTPALVMRFIPDEIPTMTSLKLPEVLADLIMEKRGLVLLVGTTGSGKTTTLASMIDHRNQSRSGHILTLEDPIEFNFKNQKSIINQREIGPDALSLQISLKNALRQAPDVILIGEIRDRETMSAALAYGQAGHLVLSTLHANNAYHALNRIISFYPLESRAALLSDMSICIRAIVSQRLLKARQGGRIPACEVLLNTRHVAELIEKGKIDEIKEAMEKSMAEGSVTFEQDLYRLIQEGIVAQDEAVSNADSATNLLWLLNNQGQPVLKKTEDQERALLNDRSLGASFKEFNLDV
jgi:twitching motility protein PilU